MQDRLSERVRLLRKFYKLNLQTFAKGCDLSHVTLFNLEKAGKISEKSLLKLVACYGTTREWLLEGRGQMLPCGRSEVAYDKIDGLASWKEEAWRQVNEKRLLNQDDLDKLKNILRHA